MLHRRCFSRGRINAGVPGGNWSPSLGIYIMPPRFSHCSPLHSTLTSDASSSFGFGAFFNGEWFSGSWVFSQASHSITYRVVPDRHCCPCLGSSLHRAPCSFMYRQRGSGLYPQLWNIPDSSANVPALPSSRLSIAFQFLLFLSTCSRGS